jgi:hypothetical protein
MTLLDGSLTMITAFTLFERSATAAFSSAISLSFSCSFALMIRDVVLMSYARLSKRPLLFRSFTGLKYQNLLYVSERTYTKFIRIYTFRNKVNTYTHIQLAYYIDIGS